MELEQKKEIARRLTESDEYMQVLAEIFLETEDKLTYETVNNKTNEELGEIVRADSIAEQKIATRFNRLKMLGQPKLEAKPAAKS